MVSLSYRRKPSMGSVFLKPKQISKWENAMKKFTESREVLCRFAPLEVPTSEVTLRTFPTGSKYEGTFDELGMSGYGTYTFPNGIYYVGEIEDGVLNGKGQLHYTDTEGHPTIIRGIWRNGVLTEKTLQFSKRLEYNQNDWRYCLMPDRRFAVEYEKGLRPSGKSYLTAKQPTPPIPYGYYDTGDGLYNPKARVVYKHNDLTAIQRAPSVREQKWIVDNCRSNPDLPRGPRQDLYETWCEPTLQPQPQPAPAAGVKHGDSNQLPEEFVMMEPTILFYDADDATRFAPEYRPRRHFNRNINVHKKH